MNPFRKLVVVLALVTLATLASTSTAFTSTALVLYEGAAARGVCDCCPATCGGGRFYGCYNTVNMPPDAVTCVYTDAAGNLFSCVSCINRAPVADTDVATDASR